MGEDWYTEEVKRFVKNHLHSDPYQLLLNHPKQFGTNTKQIVEQIIARTKLRKKIPAWFQNFDLILPPPTSVEQASSQATADYKAQFYNGEQLFDLTGGMGIDTLALSKNFLESTYVEKNENLASLFKHNSGILGRPINVINADVNELLKTLSGAVDSYFIDPVRRNEKARFFKLEDCEPRILSLLPKLPRWEQILIKLSPLLDIRSVLKAIPFINEIHLVSVKNECKEVLVWCTRNTPTTPKLVCVNLESKQSDYRFTLDEESRLPNRISHIADFIYIPNRSILKAGGFKKIGFDFNLTKLNPNTHLYTSDVIEKNFPGQIYKVLDKNFSKEKVENSSRKMANIMTRNYPLSATELKKEWKLKEGGTHFVIALRNRENRPQVVLAEQVTPGFQ